LRTAHGDNLADAAIMRALDTVRELDIPHLEPEDYPDDVVVH
jgi:hypothetical protein